MLLQLSPPELIFYSFIAAFVLVTEGTHLTRKLILRWIYYWDWVKRKEFGRYNRLRPSIVKSRKPWDCFKCMTGWCALVLALLSGYNWESIVWCGVGIVAGALFESIKMRWL